MNRHKNIAIPNDWVIFISKVTCNNINNSNISKITISPKFTTIRVYSFNETIETVLNRVLQVLIENQFKAYKHPNLFDTIIVESITESTLKSNKHWVIVDSGCGQAVLRGSHVYIPGIKAMSKGLQVDQTVSVFCDCEDVVKQGKKLDDPSNFLLIANGISKIDRKFFKIQNKLYQDTTNTTTNVDSSAKKPKNMGLAIEINESYHNHPSKELLDYSCTFLQNFPSILVGHLLPITNNQLILDMCSAPGGKSFHISSLHKDKNITIVSVDKSKNRLQKMNSYIESHKSTSSSAFNNIKTFVFDSTKLYDETFSNLSPNLSNLNPPFGAGKFDHIILDPPCSGLGQRPLISFSKNLLDSTCYPHLQKKLFHQAYHLLKPDGYLVYSTCTLSVDENEAIVSWALEKFPKLELIKPKLYYGHSGFSEDSNINYCVQRFGSLCECGTAEHDTVAYFIALFKKNQ